MRLALIFSLILPAAVSAQGIYANASGCARLASQATSDDVLIWDGQSMEFWESRCPITDVKQAGGGAILATLECSGEGETWETYYMIETTSDEDRFVVYPTDYPDLRTEITTCQ